MMHKHSGHVYAKVIRHWHGHVGVGAALFVVFLVFTGIVLNHEDSFKLDQREIRASWLMR